MLLFDNGLAFRGTYRAVRGVHSFRQREHARALSPSSLSLLRRRRASSHSARVELVAHDSDLEAARKRAKGKRRMLSKGDRMPESMRAAAALEAFEASRPVDDDDDDDDDEDDEDDDGDAGGGGTGRVDKDDSCANEHGARKRPRVYLSRELGTSERALVCEPVELIPKRESAAEELANVDSATVVGAEPPTTTTETTASTTTMPVTDTEATNKEGEGAAILETTANANDSNDDGLRTAENSDAEASASSRRRKRSRK